MISSLLPLIHACSVYYASLLQLHVTGAHTNFACRLNFYTSTERTLNTRTSSIAKQLASHVQPKSYGKCVLASEVPPTESIIDNGEHTLSCVAGKPFNSGYVFFLGDVNADHLSIGTMRFLCFENWGAAGLNSGSSSCPAPPEAAASITADDITTEAAAGLTLVYVGGGFVQENSAKLWKEAFQKHSVDQGSIMFVKNSVEVVLRLKKSPKSVKDIIVLGFGTGDPCISPFTCSCGFCEMDNYFDAEKEVIR